MFDEVRCRGMEIAPHPTVAFTAAIDTSLPRGCPTAFL
jgi:hypothetical protein